MHLNRASEILTSTAAPEYVITDFSKRTSVFHCFECDDPTAAFAYLDKSPICQKWNAITSKMIEGSFDFSKENPVEYLREVFYLP